MNKLTRSELEKELNKIKDNTNYRYCWYDTYFGASIVFKKVKDFLLGLDDSYNTYLYTFSLEIVFNELVIIKIN